MTDPKAAALDRLIVTIRRSFQELASAAERLHESTAIPPSLRAVLEEIDHHGPMTVPDIARAKSVSRQHIQTVADTLVERGFARFDPNPRHKRSKLLAMTDQGSTAYHAMRRAEAGPVAELSRRFTVDELQATIRVLNTLRAGLKDIGN